MGVAVGGFVCLMCLARATMSVVVAAAVARIVRVLTAVAASTVVMAMCVAVAVGVAVAAALCAHLQAMEAKKDGGTWVGHQRGRRRRCSGQQRWAEESAEAGGAEGRGATVSNGRRGCHRLLNEKEEEEAGENSEAAHGLVKGVMVAASGAGAVVVVMIVMIMIMVVLVVVVAVIIVVAVALPERVRQDV